VRVLGEERDFVALDEPHLIALIASEGGVRNEPISIFDY
jgi:hypothetical protein